MKGILRVNGLIVKYKTKYYKTHSMILNHEAIDVKYKIINVKGYWFYRKCEVALKPHYFFIPLKEEYDKIVEYFNSLLTMSQPQFEEVLVKVIQDDIDKRLNDKKAELESEAKEKSFNNKFN